VLLTSHSVNLSGLAASTTYHYRVKSRDTAGNLQVSGDLTFTTAAPLDTNPPTINDVAASNITASGVTIAWTTDEAADTQIQYGLTTSYSTSTIVSTALLTNHAVGLSGLAASTTYHYRVKSRDAAGNLRTSSDYTFTTTADVTAPTISAVGSWNVTATGASLYWATNEAADTQVEYGLTTSYGSSTTLNPARVTSHSANLTGLALGTTYHYRVKSKDAAGNLQVSGDFTFTTAATVLQTVDDGSAGNTRAGTWRRTTGKGYANDILTATKGSGSTSSTWTFSSLPSGTYQVWTTWKISSINATNATYKLYDGNTARLTYRANQRVTPTGLSADGAQWKLLGAVTVNSGRAVVKLNNAANGQVVADAVRIERVPSAPATPQPEIGLSVGGAGLISGQGVINFGAAALGAPQTRVFTVTNHGSATLTLSALNPSGIPAGFSLVQNLGATSLAAGASTTFSLRLNADAAGSFAGWITLGNNDNDESPFRFQVSGTVTDPNAPYSQTIDDGSSGHSLTGAWTRNATKGYAGDILTALAGNGSVQSNWTFANVPNGTYQIWTTWKVNSQNATNAPFSLYDGTQLVSTVRKNQRETPSIWDGTTFWESLGTITVTGGRLVVKLTNSANGHVVADAIRIQRLVPGGITAPALPIESQSTSASPPPSPAPTPSDLVWTPNAPTDFGPESNALDEVIDLLNSARMASGAGDDVHRFAADEIAREALLSLV